MTQNSKATIPASPEREPWRQLIGEGYIWTARIQHLKPFFASATVLLICAVTYTIWGVATARQDMSPVSRWERFWHEPAVTVVNAVRSWSKKDDTEKLAVRKIYNPNFLLRVSSPVASFIDGQPADFGSQSDLTAYIAAQAAAIKANGKPAAPCAAFTDFKSIANKLDGKSVLCKASAAGGMYFFAAWPVNTQYPRYGIKTAAVIVNKAGDVYDIQLNLSRQQQIAGRYVTPDMIAPIMSVDFPELYK